MRFGANFPHVLGKDRAAIRQWAQTLEGHGFDYLLVIDHVAGVHPDRFGPAGPAFPYTHTTPTHELMTTMAFLAGITERIEMATSVLLLPQRETVLAAKQAAEVDILSGGRLRLAVGVGWNHVEFETLGANFHNRGRRLEEQIAVMRALWSEPLVTFQGRWHHLDRVGINPLPDRPPPLWMGGGAEPKLLERYARLADGWMPLLLPGVDVDDAIHRLRAALAAAGRDPASFGLDVRVRVDSGEPADWLAAARRWRDLGATHIALMGVGGGRTPLQTLDLLSHARQILADDLGG